jgi:hypothetical protein
MSSADTAKAVWGAIAAIALIAVLAIGAWQLGWFVEEQNQNQRTRIDQQRQGAQESWQREAQRTVADIARLPEDATANRAALVTQACSLIGDLRDEFLTDDLGQFQREECSQ